jgi:tetratricopeptide (TPR) repeat protein
VGATLYEALTGGLPIAGAPRDILRRKAHVDPMPPKAIAADAPEPIAAACLGLLRRNPAERLSGSDALRIARGVRVDRIDAAVAPGPREAPFVGRAQSLQALQEMFERSKRRTGVAVHVSGVSGIGKSALVRAFVERLAGQEQIVFLHGRCYEHEAVPYKALDGVVDSLSRHLCSLSRSDVDALLPPDVASLSRLFPVLLQARGVDDARRRQGHGPFDPIALRQRGLSALRLLLARIAALRPLIISIDDLQWTDADSITVLDELLRPPGVPGLFILCSRSESLADNPRLRSLVARIGGVVTTIALEPMSGDESCALIQAIVPPRADLDPDSTSAVAEEAGGNPFLIEQLARHAAAGHVLAGRRPTLADAFDEQLRRLPADSRRFLEMVAVCGRPVSPAILAEASSLAGELRPLLSALRSARCIRSSGPPERIEAYHDRIREMLAGGIATRSLRAIHGRLAEVMTRRGIDEPEALYEHCLGAGDAARASVHAGTAARRAAESLAFDRAATYYRRALELSAEATDRREWQTGLATALANAGRPREAADAFLDAIDGADPAERVELQRRAAEQLLIGGHIDRGQEVLGDVLTEVDVRLSKGPRTALASLVYRRARLRHRGLDFVERRADAGVVEELLRVDTCWAVMTGLAMVDMIRACDVSSRHVLLALAAGEPYRIARALAMEAAFSSVTGHRGAARAVHLLERARSLAARVDSPHATALAELTTGMAALAAGRWHDASARCEQALVILRDRCTGVTWELNGAQNFLLGALLYQGELRDVSERVPPLLADARSRGNFYVETELCTRMNLVWLAADQPDEGERLAVASISRWSQRGFHRQHYSAALARVQTELYRGAADAAWALCEECRPALGRTLLLRVQLVRVEFAYLRGRCALAMASASRAPRRFLAIARREASRIAGEHMPWSDPIAALLNAGVSIVEGNAPASAARLTAAIEGFDRAGMQLYAATARRRLGALRPDEHGQESRRRADDWMAAQKVNNPAFMTRMLAPGFPEPS